MINPKATSIVASTGRYLVEIDGPMYQLLLSRSTLASPQHEDNAEW